MSCYQESKLSIHRSICMGFSGMAPTTSTIFGQGKMGVLGAIKRWVNKTFLPIVQICVQTRDVSVQQAAHGMISWELELQGRQTPDHPWCCSWLIIDFMARKPIHSNQENGKERLLDRHRQIMMSWIRQQQSEWLLASHFDWQTYFVCITKWPLRQSSAWKYVTWNS